MKAEQQKQAETLYFQSDLSKTEIAQVIGVSRRTVHYWVRQNNWDIIRQSAQAMPAILAGNCYLMMANLQDNILSAERGTAKPVTLQEVNTLHRLTMTIDKLNRRGALSENLEMMTRFMEFVHQQEPSMTELFKPLVNDYIRHYTSGQSVPAAPVAAPQKDEAEEHLDQEDLAAWAQTSNMSDSEPTLQPIMHDTRNEQKTDSRRPEPPKRNAKTNSSAPGNNNHNLNRAARRALARAAA